MSKSALIAICAAAIALIATACSAPPPTPAPLPPTAPPAASGPKVLRMGVTAYPDVMDPQKSSVTNEIAVLQLAYEGLTRLDEKGNVVPGASDHWESSADGTSMTFHIRDGLKRSDGTPITCADFEYALKREVDPFTVGKQYTSIVYDIKGAKELDDYANSASPDKLDKNKVADLFKNYGVSCTDPSNLKVEFTNPVGFWQYIASTWVTYPTDKRAVDADPDNWWTKPSGHVGNGPYIIKTIDQGNKITFEPNPNYWGGQPKLDRIEMTFNPDNQVLFEAYKNGELDIIPLLPEQLQEVESNPALKAALQRYAAATTVSFAFNNSRKPFDDKNVRIAFSQAFDRNGYSTDVNKGVSKPYTRWIPPGVPGAQADKPGVPDTDFKAAVNTLVNNGYAAADSTAAKPKVDCSKLGELKLTYASSPAANARSQYIAANLVNVFGCPVTLDPIDATTLAAISKDVKTNPQISRQGWNQDYPHPQDWLSLYWVCGGFSAKYGYCNPKLDQMLQDADRTTNFEDAIKKYSAAEDLLLSDVPGAMVYYLQNLYLVAPYLKGPSTALSTSDAVWAGQYGPLLKYDVDLSTVPANYPKQ